MWYKLSGKTNMAIWITLSGLVVTAIVIMIFMPRYSYWAAAWGHLASYAVMLLISSILGAKYYPIPYRWGRIFLIFLLMGAVYGLSLLVDGMFFQDAVSGLKLVLKLSVHTILILAYCITSYIIIKQKPI